MKSVTSLFVGALALNLMLATVGFSQTSTNQPNKAMPSQSRSSGPVQWRTDYKAALSEAQASGKPLVLFFTGSNWCPACQKLKQETINTKEFSDAVQDRYVFVELDFPKGKRQDPAIESQNRQLQSKYNIQAYPTLIIINPNEKFIGKVDYQTGGRKLANEIERQVQMRANAQ